MKSMYDVIKRPIITEKTNGLVEKLQYTFEVDPSANKTEIKDAVEHMPIVGVTSNPSIVKATSPQEQEKKQAQTQ